MKTNKIKKYTTVLLLGMFLVNTMNPLSALAISGDTDIIYPLKQISKLDCRFTDFGELNSDCKEDLPILKTSDYQKYATENGGYNKYTRLYTVLWGSSYKYGWDVGNGGHMGVDIATAKGTPVYAIAEGTVMIASELSMLGNNVTIKHKINGKEVVSSYSHMSKIDIKKGDTVKAGTKIGEVGSTGNSTGNHLHFQIDIDTKSSPAYYSYESCPYSYYKISEEGVCFSELERLTVDPLAFLETKGAILDNITTTTKVNVNKNTSTTTNTNNQSYTIFDRTVYIGYSSDDIKQVQNIYRLLGYYNGPISGDYNDILESIIDYQVATNVIENRNSTGAGRFGPATRAQTKKDYEKYLAAGTTNNSSDTITEVTNVASTTQKISKEKLMTREEIEAKEVEEFIKGYNIDLKFQNASSNVALGKTEVLKLTITDKRNKPFIGNMPGGMTFILNTETASVFPTKLFNFTDGKRDIQITGLKEGITKLYIKVGTVTVKTFEINVFNSNKTIYPTASTIISPNSITMGDSQSAIGVFKDSNNTNLINVPFGSTFKLVASEGNKVCIKTGTLKNISQVYKRRCDESEFKSEITFTYNDTISGLLIYDYKAINKDAKFEIINTYNNQVLAAKNLKVTEPKGLANTYEYKNDVLTMIEKGVATGINKGYFLENRDLTEYDSYVWVKNSLVSLNNQTTDTKVKTKIENNIKDINIQLNKASKYTSINRGQFLAMTYKYLVINQENNNTTKKYRDLTETENKLATYVLGNKTFKDQFGETYFQPTKNITRGEATFMLANIFNSYNNKFLTLK
ncbi:MAG: M23 family metallopeptidase [Candidatus Gracilibacteria bacterium]|nr:M23 family metallopeptidase [Candidatus Gracilibacteria bacterium]